VSDVLYYYGDQVPNFVQYKATDPAHVMPGYDYEVVDEDILTRGLSVADHRIRLANGTEYRELVMPPLTNISLPAMQAIERLVNAGATVVGARPTRLTGLPSAKATDADVEQIANRLWADCGSAGKTAVSVGSGKIVCGESARQALEDAGIMPDLTSAGPAVDETFDFVHRRTHGAEIYFVRNKKPASLATVLSFRARGLAPEIWNPETGTSAPVGVYDQTKDARTKVPAWFGPFGSIVVIFRRASGTHLTRLECNGQEIFPRLPANTAPFTVDMRSGGMVLLAGQGGKYVAIDTAGRKHEAVITDPAILPFEKPWKLAFTPGWGAPAEVNMSKLASWTESGDEGVRHFSGTATYTTDFAIPQQLPVQAHVMLDLGEVRETARVTVNGKEIGVLWKQPFQIDVTSAAKSGTNALKVQVTNLWPNRIIGDQSLPESKRFTHTNINKFKADSPLIPSGLLGPVTVRIESSVEMTAEPSRR
jgi:hypothetical protein